MTRRCVARALFHAWLAWIACALGCGSAATGASPAVVATAPGSLAAQVDARFRDLDRSDGPGCSVAVSRRGTTVLARGYGMANLDHGVHNTPGTAFYVASVAKQVTALVVALLAHDGVLAVDDDVRTYIPELPDYGTPVRIQHLLHHTSGVRDYSSLRSYAGLRYADLLTAADALDLIVKQPLDFAPGTRFSYSSSNTRVRGGMPATSWERVARSELTPAGLTRYAGRFRNDELGVEWTFVAEADRLVLHRPRHDDVALTPVVLDVFVDEPDGELLRFEGRRWTVTSDRIHELAFTRAPAPVAVP